MKEEETPEEPNIDNLDLSNYPIENKPKKEIDWRRILSIGSWVLMFCLAVFTIVKYGDLYSSKMALDADYTLKLEKISELQEYSEGLDKMLTNTEMQRYHLVKGFCRQLEYDAGFVGAEDDYTKNITVTCVKTNTENLTGMRPFELYD